MLNAAIIDLSAIKSNAEKIKKILPPKTRFCAVVKANAYGHGAEKVSSAIYGVADCFAVALAEEGVSLRLSGIDKEILVLNPLFKADAVIAARYNLTLAADNAKDLYYAEAAGKSLGKKVFVHIKVNTGMNRGGASEEELNKILDFADGAEYVNISGVFSHYGAPENDELFYGATERFIRAKRLVKSFDKNVIAHISASGGFLRGAYFDMVRTGILLYGYKPFFTDKISVTPAMKVYAPVTAARTVGRGETLMYGTKRLEEDSDVKIARYGYADGLLRQNIAGQFGARCMDLTAVKATVGNGKFVPVMTDAEKLAKEYRTISYEILTKSALRAEKIYIYRE